MRLTAIFLATSICCAIPFMVVTAKAAGEAASDGDATKESHDSAPSAGDTPEADAKAEVKEEKGSFSDKCYQEAAAREFPAPPPPAEGEAAEGLAEDSGGTTEEGHGQEGEAPVDPEHTHASPDNAPQEAGEKKNDESSHAEEPDASEAPAIAESQPPMPKYEGDHPYELIRTLEFVQDQIALGNRQAHLNQRALIQKIEKKIAEVPDEVWKEPRNSRAAIMYALSGGNPRILEKLLSISPLPCLDENLIKGLLAYSQGLNQVAKSRLSQIDPLALGSRVAAHLSLAQSMLVAGEAPNKAIYYLDLARILAPGTLLEEAALRRETVITALIEDFDKFEALVSQYLRRFPKSVYLPEFISRFAVAVVNGRYARDEKLMGGLTQMLDRLKPEYQQAAYLAITQAAIVRGGVALAKAGAQRLVALAKDTPGLKVQARLYEAAATLVTDQYDDALKMLDEIKRDELPIRDKPLYDAARNLAARLRMPPQVAEPLAAPPPVSAEQGKEVESASLSQVLELGKTTISSANDLLSGE